MATFDWRWVEAANRALRGHRTGAVPEFSVALQLAFDDPAHPDCWVVAAAGRQRFLADHGRPADVVARLPYEQAAQAFAHDDQTVFMNEVMATGDLWLEGDFAKARFFLGGLVRNAPPSLVRTLRSIP